MIKRYRPASPVENVNGEYVKIEDVASRINSILILKVPLSIQYALEAFVKELR